MCGESEGESKGSVDSEYLKINRVGLPWWPTDWTPRFT